MVKWQPRVGPLLAALNRMVDGRPALQIDPGPDTEHLRRALSGRWHYPRRPNGEIARDDPVKDHPWSDLGDCMCYAVGGAAPSRDPEERERLNEHYRQHPPKAIVDFDVFEYHHPPRWTR